MILTRMLFELGRVTATYRALDALKESGEDPYLYLGRHVTGDWGELPYEDQEANNYFLITGERLMSSYRTSRGITIWVITEADRSLTLLLLPDDYQDMEVEQD